MGGTRWSEDHYTKRETARTSRGAKSAFEYHDSLRDSGKDLVVHPTLDPQHRNKIGELIRESLDSETHPDSRAVVVLFAVTASMCDNPPIFQKHLPKLMSLLIDRGFLDDPHVLLGAIGDAHGDEIPLQIGQFEAGVEIDDALTNLVLEGGGGPGTEESYELPIWFFANYSRMDCLNKRQKKGYFFIIGDESPYMTVNRRQVEKLFGVKLQVNAPLSDVVKKLQEQYECFYIQPSGTAHWREEKVLAPWRELFGQNVLLLNDPKAICELIASQIGVCEGKTTVEKVETELAEEVSKETIDSVMAALRRAELEKKVDKPLNTLA